MKTARGFTLIEMLITVVLVGILASVVVPLTEMSVRRGKEQELRAALREIRGAIDAYKRAGDEGRIYRSATTTGYPATLDVLVEGAQDMKDPGRRKIYFLRRVPRDPMNPDLKLAPTATWGKRLLCERSGSDPKEGDDVYDCLFDKSAGGAEWPAVRSMVSTNEEIARIHVDRTLGGDGDCVGTAEHRRAALHP